MFYVLLYVIYVHSSIAIILMGKIELVALLNLSSWCLVMVERLFLAVPRGCLRFVIVVFSDHTHLLFSLLANNKDVDQPAHLRKLISAIVIYHLKFEACRSDISYVSILCGLQRVKASCYAPGYECRFMMEVAHVMLRIIISRPGKIQIRLHYLCSKI